jgi:hypothetical protein
MIGEIGTGPLGYKMLDYLLVCHAELLSPLSFSSSLFIIKNEGPIVRVP